MTSFRQVLNLRASPETIYAALTTPEGLRGWWTEDCDVPSGVGCTLQVRFEGTYKDLKVEHLAPGSEVRWTCTGAFLDVAHITRKDEWLGTRICFQLEAEDTQVTRLEFEHTGLTPSFECYDICSGGWQQFLGSLKLYVETGRGTPFAMSKQAAP